MQRSQIVATPISWLLAFSVLSASILIYVAVALFTQHNRILPNVSPSTLGMLRPFLNAFAFGALAVSLRIRIDGRVGGKGQEGQLSPALFLTQSLGALALSEACATVGMAIFLLGAPFKEFSLLSLGSIFVDFAFILPRGLRFWTAYENASAPQQVPPSPLDTP